MLKCLLTELGPTGRENIWHAVMAHGPRAKYFPVRPSHAVNKYIINNNNNNNNESLFDQKIKTHILCYNIN